MTTKVFEVTDKQVDPDVGSWHEQNKRTCKANRNKKAGALAAMIVDLAALACTPGTRADRTQRRVRPPRAASVLIGFVSDRDGNFEIYVMNASGTGLTRLTHNEARSSTRLGRLTAQRLPSLWRCRSLQSHAALDSRRTSRSCSHK